MQGVLPNINVLSELMRPQPSAMVLAWFTKQKATEFYTSAITQAKLLPDGKCRDAVAALVAVRNKLGMPISTDGAQIAAIALRNGLALATRNIKDFYKINELDFINRWLIA